MNIYELLEAKKAHKKLSKKDQKRLKEFKKKARILDKFWTGKCLCCDEAIHKDADFCSSVCYRTYWQIPTREEMWRDYIAKKGKERKESNSKDESKGTKET